MQGLEGKLNGQVAKGDIILLKSDIVDVTGFVLDYDIRQVKIGYKNPFNPENQGKVYKCNFTKGDKHYALQAFNDFEILRDEQRPEDLEHAGLTAFGILSGASNGTKAYKGDVLLLKSPDLQLVGFLYDFSKTRITLVHEEPLKVERLAYTKNQNMKDAGIRLSVGPGIRTFYLAAFEDNNFHLNESEKNNAVKVLRKYVSIADPVETESSDAEKNKRE